MSFGDFPDQQAAVSLLQKSLRQGRLGHAYLLSGESMGEMEGLARTLAKTLNCANPPSRGENGQGIDSCDECSHCRRIDGGNHPDVQWARPESKIRQITIDQIRELIQIISLKPTEAVYKVTIMAGADRMNTQAANSFLKTLEEPPAKSIIILLTSDYDRVLETIVSRCLRLNCGGGSGAKLTPEEQEWLQSIADMASEPTKSLLGRYRLLSVITSRLAAIKEQTGEQLEAASPLARYPDADKDTRDRWESELNAAVEAEYRRKRSDLLLLLQWWMRDIWLASLQLPESDPALPQLSPSTSRVAQRITRDQASENLRALEKLQRQLHTNVQETLALEIGLLKLAL